MLSCGGRNEAWRSLLYVYPAKFTGPIMPHAPGFSTTLSGPGSYFRSPKLLHLEDAGARGEMREFFRVSRNGLQKRHEQTTKTEPAGHPPLQPRRFRPDSSPITLCGKAYQWRRGAMARPPKPARTTMVRM